jgi:hypothetical protein
MSALPALAGLGDGERRRDAALQLLRDRRASLIRRGQRALVGQLLSTGIATADDVRASQELSPGIDPRCMGAVPGELVFAGIIRPAGYVRTARPAGHGRPVLRWQLVDAAAARAWLAAHPALPDPDPADRCERTLWD